MRSGYMLRRDMATAARGERPCGGCGHPNYVHHELPRVTYSLNAEKTEIVETPNPDYRPLHFHCDWPEGCDCVMVSSADGKTHTYEKAQS